MARRTMILLAAVATALAGASRAAAQAPDVRAVAPPWAQPAPDDAGALRPGRLALETAGALALGTAWYLRNINRNALDWDLPVTWESLGRKLTFDAVRFDSNDFSTNAWGHPRAGMIYYGIARGNGASMLGSTVSNLVATSIWEYLIEYREYVSINDMISNTAAGVSVGEPVYQLGMFFRRSSPNVVNRVLGTLLAPAVAVNDWVDERRPPRAPVDRYGLARDGWHRLMLGVGAGHASPEAHASSTQVVLVLDVALVNLPGYLSAGRHARVARPGSWSGIDAQLDLGAGGLAAAEVRSRTLVIGRHWQSIASRGAGGPRGAALLAGLGSDFEFWRRWLTTAPRDHLGRLGLIGPQVELAAVLGPLRVRWENAAFLDLGMVYSLAAASRGVPVEGGVRGTLRELSYYFAWGGTVSSRLFIDAYGWDLGGEVRWSGYQSLQGWDRYQESIERDVKLEDQRLVVRGALGFRPLDGWLRFGTSLEHVERRSELLGRTARTREVIGRASVSVVF